MATSNDIVVPYDAWIEVARKYYGSIDNAKFRCPACGNIQSAEAIMNETGMERQKARSIAPFCCKGRMADEKERKCAYTLGGLIVLDHVLVEKNGNRFRSFLFDDPSANDDLSKLDVLDERKRAMDELRSRCEKAGDTWNWFEWDAWVPDAVRQQIIEFWGCWGRTPMSWFEDIRPQEPVHGTVVTKDAMKGGKEVPFTGQYIHAWNNMGRLCLDDGTHEVVSS